MCAHCAELQRHKLSASLTVCRMWALDKDLLFMMIHIDGHALHILGMQRKSSCIGCYVRFCHMRGLNLEMLHTWYSQTGNDISTI